MEEGRHHFLRIFGFWLCARMGVYHMQRAGKRQHHLYHLDLRDSVDDIYAGRGTRGHYEAAPVVEVDTMHYGWIPLDGYTHS